MADFASAINASPNAFVGAPVASSGSARVALGVTRSGNINPMKFRPKPGDKYKYNYRFSTDGCDPEFGLVLEVPGRHIVGGRVVRKGKSVGHDYWRQQRAAMLADTEGASAPDGPVGCLLLDCDGTIVETERDGHRVAFNEAFKKNDFEVEWDVKLYGELLTTGGGKERMVRYFTDYNKGAWKANDPPTKEHPDIVALHASKTKLFMEIAGSGALRLRPGIESLIGEATAAGWAVGVCSTSNEQAVRAVVQTALPKYAPFMKIFAGDIVEKKKPDPEIYNLAANEIGVAPMKCVVVEDAAIGCKAAKAAGMQVIVTKSIYTQDETFDSADIVKDDLEDTDFFSVQSMLPVLESLEA